MMGVRAGLVSVLSGVVVAGLVNAPPATAAGGGLWAGAPHVAAQSARAAVAVPFCTRTQPTVRFRSTTKLVVNVNPNLSGSKNWKFVLRRRTATGAWERVGVYRTRGPGEIRRLRVEPGTYRVRVRERRNYRGVTTRVYRHTPSVVTTVVSVRFDGGRVARKNSSSPAISANGRWIAYASGAGNLITDDTNNKGDVFLFDRNTRTTRRVSVRTDGGQATGGRSALPAISADGRWITYTSEATNLVDDDTNGNWDVFLFDRDTGQTRRVSVRSDGGQATGSRMGRHRPAISADGRWITYVSPARDLVDDDTNGVKDVFLFDRDTGQTRRVSVRTDGGQATGESGSPAISADGRWITYPSTATDLVDDDTNEENDVFLFDRDTGQTRRVSVGTDGRQANGSSGSPAISADGRWITYASKARNLVAEETNRKGHVFLFDRDTGQTRRVSVGTDGRQANGSSGSPSISADGRWITYASQASNLVADDTNGQSDVFVFDRKMGTTRRVSVPPGGGQFSSSSPGYTLGSRSGPAISADGRWITYTVYVEATYADPNRGGVITDVFLTRMW